MTAETVANTRGAQRLAVLEAVRAELDERFTAIAGGALDGIRVVSRGEVDEAIAQVKASPLPPIDAGTAEVRTPADVYVDAICPECELPTRVLVQLSAVLETTREAGSTIKLKAKAKGRGHVHHQLALEEGSGDQQDFGLEDIVRPEDQLSDDEKDQPDAGDVDMGEGAPSEEGSSIYGDELAAVQPDDDSAPPPSGEDTEPEGDPSADEDAIHRLRAVPPPETKGDEPDDLSDLPF